MKKALISLLLTLCLALAPLTALADAARIESLEYKGFGVLELEFTKDCDWYASANLALSDAQGAVLSHIVIGGEEDNCYLRAEALQPEENYVLAFSLEGVEQEIPFQCVSGVEYKIGKDGEVAARTDDEDCDNCSAVGHDEEFCPERIDAAALPEDPDALARIFDIDRCDDCGGIGHDDDHCPNR